MSYLFAFRILVLRMAVIVISLLVSTLVANSDDSKSLPLPMRNKAIRDYLLGNADARRAVLADLADKDEIKASDIKGLVTAILNEAKKLSPKWAPQKKSTVDGLTGQHASAAKMMGGGNNPVQEVTTPNGTMKVIVLGKAKKGQPIVIYLHGGGNIGGSGPADNQMAWNWGIARSKDLTNGLRLLPKCVDDFQVNSWIMPDELHNIETVLNEFLRTNTVDSDQVSVVGVSMGAFGVWPLASICGDRFASLVALGGGCTLQDEDFVNLRNVSLGIFIGAEDKAATRLDGSRKGREQLEKLKAGDDNAYKHEYHEYSGIGHSYDQSSAYRDISKFLSEQRRDAYPRLVVWNPRAAWKTHWYNLSIDQAQHGMSIRAEFGTDNKIVVMSQNVSTVTIYLNDRLVDFSKEIVITWNGEEAFRGNLVPRLSVLLETLVDRYDPGMFYTAKVTLGN